MLSEGSEMLATPVLVLIAIVVLYLLNSIKILREYERGVIFRLGRALPVPKGPGIILVFRPFDQMVRISLRQDVLEVPAQDVITRDNVTLKVNAVVTLYVIDPNAAAIKVANYVYQTSQFAQTTLRSVLGEVELDELLSHRDKLNLKIQTIIDQRTEPFGVKVISVEVKQVDLPEQMLRAMAKQAEAEREKRAKVIHAGGEFDAAQKLVDAAALFGHRAHDPAVALPANPHRDRRGEEHHHRLSAAAGNDDAAEQDGRNGHGQSSPQRRGGQRQAEGVTEESRCGCGNAHESRCGRILLLRGLRIAEIDCVRGLYMRGVFDEREFQQAVPRQDTELTLSSTTLLLVFFGLVLLCGLCFGLGYATGHRGTSETAAALPAASGGQAQAPAISGGAKPAADTQAAPSSTDQSAAANPQEPNATDASLQSSAAAAASGLPNGQPLVHPALGDAANPAPAGQAASGTMSPALGAPGSMMVQIAAVTQQEDADVLIERPAPARLCRCCAPRAAGWPIHVRIGPFKTRDEAEKWRQKLLNDGYNAIVQP